MGVPDQRKNKLSHDFLELFWSLLQVATALLPAFCLCHLEAIFMVFNGFRHKRLKISLMYVRFLFEYNGKLFIHQHRKPWTRSITEEKLNGKMSKVWNRSLQT